MKIKELNPETKEFKPIELVLTIESKRELEFLWLLFNGSNYDTSIFSKKERGSRLEIPSFDPEEIGGINKRAIWLLLEEKMKQL